LEIAYIVLAVIVAAMLTVSALGKFQKSPQVIEMIVNTVGWPESRLHWLGMAEVAGAIGLLVGIAWRPLGIAAGVGVTLYFVGAVIGHLRVHDAAWKVPLFLAILGAVVTGLAIATVDC
jgi:uncharacterized membrane protein